MGLASVVRGAVATANRVTKDLQSTVSHQSAMSTPSSKGVIAYGAAVSRRALVDWKQKVMRTSNGQEVTTRASVTFLEPVAVTLLDVIILPDGTTGPILDVGGFVDASTGRPYLMEVWLG